MNQLPAHFGRSELQRLIGYTVKDRYQLLQVIGTGTMSSVFHAQDLARGNRSVAVKLLNSPHPDELRLAVFRRETRALERLDHPNIICIFDHGFDVDLGCTFVVLEEMTATLADLIVRHQHDADHTWCWSVLRSVADALVHAHSEGVIHRDLKPSNILISDDETPKLTDFGTSFLKFELNIGVTLGSFWSAGYASPEQRRGERASERSDLYSFGCVMYHMLARQAPPAEGPTSEQVDKLPGVPSRVRQILDTLLATDPFQRFESAVHLRRALDITQRYALPPEVYLLLTERARSNLFDLGLIARTSNEDDACAVILEELGGDNPRDVPVYLDKGNPQEVRLLTESLRLVCTIDRDMPVLVVKAVQLPYQAFLERQRKTAASVRFLWQAISRTGREAPPISDRPVLGETLADLVQTLQAHHETERQDRSRLHGRSDFVREWTAVLALHRSLLENTSKLPYVRHLADGSLVTFTLAQPAPDNLAWPEGAPILLLPDEPSDRDEGATLNDSRRGSARGSRHDQGVGIGRLVGVYGDEVHLSWEPDSRVPGGMSSESLPSRGTLALGQYEALAALARQEDAVHQVVEGGTLNPRLPEVLRDVSTATFHSIEEPLELFQPDLAADKRLAVQQALAADDIFLIQGPPGTGKTSVLAEIILQFIKRQPDARILISSQSNVAVNHLLVRVAELQVDADMRIVRIGRPEKIGQGALDWTVAQRLANWRDDVLARTDPVAANLRRQNNLAHALHVRATHLPADARALREHATVWMARLAELTPLAHRLRWERAQRAHARGETGLSINGVSGTSITPHTPMESFGPLGGSSRRPSGLEIGEERGNGVSSIPADNRRARTARLPILLDLEEQLVAGLHTIRVAMQETSTDVPQPEPYPEQDHQRLLEYASLVADPEAATARYTKLTTMLENWRQIFGRHDDFVRPIVERANIVAATCLITGGSMLRREEFDLAIVDESGRATAAELLVPLVRARRAILVGDERQLPPMLDDLLSTDTLAAQGLSRERLSESLFATLVAQAHGLALPAVCMLKTQYRMHPAIGRMIGSVFYDGLLEQGTTEQDRQHGLAWLPRAIVWISTSADSGRFESRTGTSLYNVVEARVIERLLLRMENDYAQRGEQRGVAVISAYQAQVSELHHRIQPDDTRWHALHIEVATVDSIQGRDQDIVLYSPVRSNRTGDLGFLRDRRRLNVALSRARELLVIVGDIQTLEHGRGGQQGNPYLEITRYLRLHPADSMVVDADELERR